jgi:cellulose/xylan binding protein with CBM9 domain
LAGAKVLSPSIAVKVFAGVCLVLALFAAGGFAANDRSIESMKADNDVVLTTDTSSSFWQGARAVYAERDRYGRPLPRYRTEIRSRWTKNNLYFLFICRYDTLYLKPDPDTSTETFQLWNWDVAEVFIGSDFQNIRRYKEFEVSPQGERIDLDIDLTKPQHEDGWKWNSGFQISTRINRVAKTWYAAMRIPLAAIAQRPSADGATFRINLFRAQGPPSERKYIAWQPTMSDSFHVPERFGILKLVSSPAH